jgi:hypothetical protein
MLLTIHMGQAVVSGATEEEIQKARWQRAVQCGACKRTLVSYSNHDYKTCGCPNNTMVDGGQLDYYRYGGVDMMLVNIFKLDALTGEIDEDIYRK